MQSDLFTYLIVVPIIIGGIVVGLFVGALVDLLHDYLARFIKGKYAINWITIFVFSLIVPLILGLVVSSTLGSPSCEETDEIGHCISRADDGFEATDNQKIEKFKSVFFSSSFVLSSIAFVSLQDKKQNKDN